MEIVNVRHYNTEELIAIAADIVIELRERKYSDKEIIDELGV